MANQEHVALLKKDVKAWNDYKRKGYLGFLQPDLRKADLSGAKLLGANLSEADLSEANLSGADLTEATLSKAVLSGANLSRVDLRKANLDRTDLKKANLSGANLSGRNLSEVDLSGTNLSRADLGDTKLRGTNLTHANLREANLSGVDLGNRDFTTADLSAVDFRQTNLIDAILDKANLTGAKLWGTRRDGWSIKNIICEYAYWDRDAKEATHYVPGEFERLHKEGLKVELYYEGGIRRAEILTLPMLLQHLEEQHQGCVLRLQSIEDAPGGAKATIMIDESGNAEPKQLEAKLNDQAREFQIAQRRYLEAETSRLKLESQVEILRDNIIPTILEYAMADKKQISIGQIGTVGSLGDISGDAEVNIDQSVNYTQNDLVAIKNIIAEILNHRAELEKTLPPKEFTELRSSTKEIQDELQARDPNPSIIKKALGSVHRILEGGAGNVVGSSVFQALQSLL